MLRNADNYCFFVNDIQPFAKTPECPSLPRCSFDKTCSCPNGLIKREEETTTGNICFTCGKTPSKKPKPRPHNTGGDLCPADDTGGTCRVFLCSRTRGPTTCASGKCVCETGLCAENGYCVPPKVGGESLGSEPDDTCDTATGGTCKFLWCFHSRGPTSCIDARQLPEAGVSLSLYSLVRVYVCVCVCPRKWVGGRARGRVGVLAAMGVRVCVCVCGACACAPALADECVRVRVRVGVGVRVRVRVGVGVGVGVGVDVCVCGWVGGMGGWDGGVSPCVRGCLFACQLSVFGR